MHFSRCFVIASALVAATAPALVQQFPERPVRLVTTFAPGAGAMDTAARVTSEKMAARLNTPVLVVNQPGAGGTLAAGNVARGPKDG
jgi:tripartite-type tricarboxylate transporter receptor subunit TctC